MRKIQQQICTAHLAKHEHLFRMSSYLLELVLSDETRFEFVKLRKNVQSNINVFYLFYHCFCLSEPWSFEKGQMKWILNTRIHTQMNNQIRICMYPQKPLIWKSFNAECEPVKSRPDGKNAYSDFFRVLLAVTAVGRRSLGASLGF